LFFKLNIFGVFLIIISFLCLYFTIYSFKKREDKIYYYFGLLSLFCFIDFIFQGLECLTTPFNVQLIFTHLCTFGFIFIPSIWLLLSYCLVTVNPDITKKLKVAIYFLPVVFSILVIFNPLTHWVFDFTSPTVNTVYNLQLVLIPHLGYKLIVFYNYLCVFITVLLIFYGLIKGSKIFRKTYLILLLTSVVEILINLLSYTPLYPGFHYGVASYAIAIIFLYVAVFAYHQFDLVSIMNENVINDIDVGILFFDTSNCLMSVNPAGSLLNVYQKDLGEDFRNVFKDDEDVLSFYESDSKVFQTQVNDKWIEINKSSLFEGDSYMGKILTMTDVTSSVYELEQKDMLLKEVNHRVKNNLQIILSLLNLDMRFHPDDPMSVINDTRSRLNYMAELHEKIYASNSGSDVDIKEYLPEIAQSLISMYNSNIQLVADLESFSIDLDLAVSLGLILTEIINNAVKYAFKVDSWDNKFSIVFKITSGEGVLDLFDNGQGLPEGFDLESGKGLGMTVIKSLTSQIDGDLSIVPDSGAHFRIKFPL
jgi:two-component sensor histidine kinase